MATVASGASGLSYAPSIRWIRVYLRSSAASYPSNQVLREFVEKEG